MPADKVLMITAEEKKAIKITFNRSDEEINEDIAKIKEWLSKQPHLPQNEDEARIRNMLQFNKFSLEKTKNKLNMYYSLKNLAPEFYSDREPLNADISKLMDGVYLMPLPHLAPDNCRVLFGKLKNNDSTAFRLTPYLKYFFGIADLRMVNDPCVGDHFVFDCEHIAIAQFIQITPVIAKKWYNIIQKGYSDKIKGMHFLNLPSYGTFIVNILNSLLSEKLAKRVIVHKNIESLQKILPAKVLPNEYGGTAGPFDELYEEWAKYFRSKNDWLIEEAKRTSDESKRIGEPLNSDIFGVVGSFRKLTLD